MIKIRIDHYDEHTTYNLTCRAHEVDHIVVEYLTLMDIPMEEASNAAGWCVLASSNEEFEGTGYAILICSHTEEE